MSESAFEGEVIYSAGYGRNLPYIQPLRVQIFDDFVFGGIYGRRINAGNILSGCAKSTYL